MLAVVLIAVFLCAAKVFSCSTPPSKIPDAETQLQPKSEASTLSELFAVYQSDPANYGNSSDLVRSGGEPVWSGCPVYLFKKELVEKYLRQVDQMDIKKVLMSFKVCKESDALSLWEEYMLANNKSPIFTVTLKNIRSEPDLVEIEPFERIILEEIIQIWNTSHNEHYVQDFEAYLLGTRKLCPDTECNNTSPLINRKIVASILANKTCLYAVVISLFKKAGDPEQFVESILPFLDRCTRNRFLSFLETSSFKFDVNKWRRWQLPEENTPFDLSMLSNGLRYVTRWLKSTIFKPAPMDPSTFAIFSLEDIATEVLAKVDLNTLLYSAPYVSKLFNRIIDKKFIVQMSTNLSERLNAQAPKVDPYRLCLVYPWNAFFASARQLVKYHLLTNKDVTDKRWLTAALETLNESGNEKELGIPGEIDYAKGEMLKRCLECADISKLLANKDIPISDWVRIFDILLQDAITIDLHVLGVKKLMYLLKHVKEGAKLLNILCEKVSLTTETIIIDIMFLSELEMSESVVKRAEKYCYENYEQRLSLPLSADQIMRCKVDFLEQLIRTREDDSDWESGKVSLKIFTTFVDRNALDRLNVPFWNRFISHTINMMIKNDPTAISPKYFETALDFIYSGTRYDCTKFLEFAVRRINERLAKKT